MHLSKSSQENFTVASAKDMTWKTLLSSILEGYACVALFFILARYLTPNFLFSVPQGYQPKFEESLYLQSVAFFLILYTIYQVNKIIGFSLRKNRHFLSIYGGIHRFFVTYTWCLYICIIPFCFLDPINFGFFDNFARVLKYYGSLNSEVLKILARDLYAMSMVLTFYLIMLILLQRLMVTCYLAMKNKPMGKHKKNALFWQSTEASILITRYASIRCFIERLGKFCYWFALNILTTTCIAPWGVVIVMDVFWVWLRIAFCYLAFRITMQDLLIALWQRVYLCIEKRA